jgi:hypothetical protein
MSQTSYENFPGIFGIFRVFFVPLKQFLDNLSLFGIKNKFEKTNPIRPFWAETVAPTHLRTAQPQALARPIWPSRPRLGRRAAAA